VRERPFERATRVFLVRGGEAAGAGLHLERLLGRELGFDELPLLVEEQIEGGPIARRLRQLLHAHDQALVEPSNGPADRRGALVAMHCDKQLA
jgi:hypothetical protein